MYITKTLAIGATARAFHTTTMIGRHLTLLALLSTTTTATEGMVEDPNGTAVEIASKMAMPTAMQTSAHETVHAPRTGTHVRAGKITRVRDGTKNEDLDPAKRMDL